MKIIFFIDHPKCRVIQRKKIKQWIIDLLKKHGKGIDSINIIFTDKTKLLKINKQFLKHDYYTDIVTFDYTTTDKINAEIYISYDAILENSKVYKVSIFSETLRVIIHGILHILGYNDNNKKSKTLMRREEDKALEIFFS